MEWVSASVRGRRHRPVSTEGPVLAWSMRSALRLVLFCRLVRCLSLSGWEMKMLMVGFGARERERRALSDGSRGTAAVWQLWKFIAIDFVISSLSIVSTGSFWWIARKLFLQTCFFNLHLTHTQTRTHTLTLTHSHTHKHTHIHKHTHSHSH